MNLNHLGNLAMGRAEHRVGLLLVLVAACALGAEPAAPTVTVAPAAVVDHAPVELLPGTVRADRSVVLMARVSGVVNKINAVPGTQVAAGTVLVELDAQELSARRDQAVAVAAQAAADLARAQQLVATQVVTRADFDAARARSTAAAASVVEADILVGYTKITAPFAGMVIRRHAETGDLLSPGRPVIALEDPATLRLEVSVPESLAGGIALGATFKVRIGEVAVEAPVVEITPAADPVSRSVLIKAALPGDEPRLRSGQFGRLALPVAGRPLLVVPTAALVQRGQLDAVFVVTDGIAHLRLVRLGGPLEGNTAIRAGLVPGDRVVVSGGGGLVDGQAVNVAAP